jgi:hypothetical protein
MTKLELQLYTELSAKKLDIRCSDYVLPNTDEHWDIVESALADNVNKTREQYRADVDDIEYRERPTGDEIYTDDYLILGYLHRKALSELSVCATD